VTHFAAHRETHGISGQALPACFGMSMRLMLLRAPVGADRSVIGKSLIDGQILRSRLHSNAPIRPNAFAKN
jgi:hypothetical protein